MHSLKHTAYSLKVSVLAPNETSAKAFIYLEGWSKPKAHIHNMERALPMSENTFTGKKRAYEQQHDHFLIGKGIPLLPYILLWMPITSGSNAS